MAIARIPASVVRIRTPTLPERDRIDFHASGQCGHYHARIWRVGEALDYGMIAINTGFISTEVAPFGGVKESGIGREGSKYGMEEFLEVNCLCLVGLDR